MRKVLWSSAMIGCTLLSALTMLAWTPREELVEARIVQVKRGDVHRVVALTGHVAYADERLIYAQSNGRVDQVCASVGERVGQDEALVRLNADTKEGIVSAFVAASNQVEAIEIPEFADEQLSMGDSVIRADSACTVREVYVQEDTLVSTGMPVARVSSHQQEIVCLAAAADAEKVSPGMWAWISKAEASYGFAEVLSVGNNTVDPITGTTCAEVRLRPEQHIELSEGENLDVEVYIAGSDDVLTLPIEAITERDTVWWVSEGRCTEIPAGIVMNDEMLAWVALPEGISIAVGEFYNGQPVVEAIE